MHTRCNTDYISLETVKLVRLQFSSSADPSLLMCFNFIPNNQHTIRSESFH